MFKISFDLGGVVTKYPKEFVAIIKALQKSEDIKVLILTDMCLGNAKKILDKIGLEFEDKDIFCADWNRYQEECKAIIIRKEQIDLHIDDLPSYCQSSAISLMVWPNNQLPYNILNLEETNNDE